MMRIDSVAARPDRAGRHLVKLSDGTTLRLYPQTVEDFGLYSGMELTEQMLQQLTNAEGKMSAKMRAVRIVAAANVSKADLQQRLLQKGESDADAKQAVEWMESLQLVDDEKTAEMLVQKCVVKGYGKARAKQMLYEKKIPREIWDRVLENYPDQTDKIVAFLQGRLGENSQRAEIKKAVDALMRRGHSYREIRVALSRILEDCDSLQEEF